MLSPNTILQNRYRVVRELGHGGMGTVYEAIDQRVNCKVALKETLHAQDSDARTAFEREAALLANLRHQALPKVMDYFSEDNGDFLVMEFIPGYDLAELLDLRGGPFPQSQVLRWADDLLRVLEYLHEQEPPILHRDIKPSNLKLTKAGEVFLLDFGLAKGSVGEMPTLATSRSVRGYTPVYASLEQILSQGTDPRSDLYSLGATIYHILSGVRPMDAPKRFQLIEDGGHDPLEPIHKLNPQASRNVAAVIQQAMAMSRKQRPISATEMRKALRNAAEEDERSSAEEEYRRAEEKRRERDEERQNAAAEEETQPAEKDDRHRGDERLKAVEEVARFDETVTDGAEPINKTVEHLNQATEPQVPERLQQNSSDQGERVRLKLGNPVFNVANKPDPTRPAVGDQKRFEKEVPAPPPTVLVEDAEITPTPTPITTIRAQGRVTPPPEVLSDKRNLTSDFVPSRANVPKRFLFISIAVVALVLVGVYVGWKLSSNGVGGNSKQTQQPNQATEVKTHDNKPVSPPGMVYVPGGEFMMGRNDGDEFERPAHRVKVEPFFIDQHEVTNEDYSKFTRETGRRTPSSWAANANETLYPAGSSRKPVTGVSWDDANAYARWAKKQLPTEEQWEFAARGADGRRYPWGNEWASDMANADLATAGAVDVGTHKGASPYGAYDMVGNVWEWTASALEPYPGGSLSVQGTNLKVIRGCTHQCKPVQATTTYRRGWPATGADYSNTGFRCVKDAKE